MEKDHLISELVQYPCETETNWNVSRLRELTVEELEELLKHYRIINDD